MARQWDAAPRRQSLPLLPFAGHPTFYFKQGPEATGLVQGSLCCLAQRLEMAWIRCMHCCASPQGPTHFHTLMDQGAGCSGWHKGHHMAMYRGQAIRTFLCSLNCDSCFRLSLYSANSTPAVSKDVATGSDAEDTRSWQVFLLPKAHRHSGTSSVAQCKAQLHCPGEGYY